MYDCVGGCHCGRVKFEIKVPAQQIVHRCNCSICLKTGFLHVIVPKEQFRLLEGEADLAEYRFNTGVARHLFCRVCGIKSFYVPRSHPDGYSVNLNCVELPDDVQVTIEDFDGSNWRKSRGGMTES